MLRFRVSVYQDDKKDAVLDFIVPEGQEWLWQANEGGGLVDGNRVIGRLKFKTEITSITLPEVKNES